MVLFPSNCRYVLSYSATRATAAAAPPTIHFAFAVTIGIPPVETELVVPEAAEAVPVLLDPFFDDVPVANEDWGVPVAAAVEIAPPETVPPAVIVTGTAESKVPSAKPELRTMVVAVEKVVDAAASLSVSVHIPMVELVITHPISNVATSTTAAPSVV